MMPKEFGGFGEKKINIISRLYQLLLSFAQPYSFDKICHFASQNTEVVGLSLPPLVSFFESSCNFGESELPDRTATAGKLLIKVIIDFPDGV